MKILISDRLSAEGLAVLKSHGEFTVVEAAGKPREEILKLVADAEALIVRSETQADSVLLAAGKKLRVVGRAGVGVDNVDLQAAKERGIVVMNTPEGNTIATAELTFAHLMNAFRPLTRAAASMKAGEWDKKNLMGEELYGKTLGIMGFGRIGTQVAKRALAFGMRVLAYDPFLKAERAKEMGVEISNVDNLLKTCDAVTLHLPLTTATRGLINAQNLAKMKKGARLINCARGELVDLEALQKALESGQLSHAGLDVFPAEPLPADHPLRTHPRAALTPHLGASTHEAQARVGVEIAESVSEYLLTGKARNTVSAL